MAPSRASDTQKQRLPSRKSSKVSRFAIVSRGLRLVARRVPGLGLPQLSPAGVLMFRGV